jgi:hypothetical protein
VDLPPEVLIFAAEQGVSDYLPAVVEMTRQLFPHCPLTVQVEDDPEIVNDRHIVLIVKDIGLEVAQALETLWQWQRELFVRCPAPLVCIFRLGMEGAR